MSPSPRIRLAIVMLCTTLWACHPATTVVVREPVFVDRPRCYTQLMPRPCKAGTAERDASGRRRCWAFARERVPNAAEVAFLKVWARWSVAIEAACVTAPRTPIAPSK